MKEAEARAAEAMEARVADLEAAKVSQAHRCPAVPCTPPCPDRQPIGVEVALLPDCQAGV